MNAAVRVRVRVAGPLAELAPGLIDYLADMGYSEKSIVEHVRRLAHVSRWMEREHLGADAIDETVIEALVDALHAAGAGRRLKPSSFRVVLGFLRSTGVTPPRPEASTPVTVLLDDYRYYLNVERALSPLTVHGYVVTAASFLAQSCDGDVDRIAGLGVGDVNRFVLTVAERRSARSTNETVVGVRSLLRFLFGRELISTPLANAVPWLARGRMSSLPRSLDPGVAPRLLASCDRGTLVGVRDYAVLSVFVRLGLRVGEVTAMELDDFDWRRGELIVRSKGGWREVLPIPVDVGDAVVAYLQRRPSLDSGERRVFIQMRAPRQAMTRTDLRAVVRRACARVGVPDASTHRLRHALACDLLRHDAPLYEIGQVLRHREMETTALYAKVDFAALATLALPWPGSDR